MLPGIQLFPISYIDDGFSQIKAIYVVSPNDWYYIRTTDTSGSAITNYALSVEGLDSLDISADAPSPTESATDVQQFWKLEVENDGTFIIAMNGLNNFDTILTLYDATGAVIEFNDDSNDTLNSQITTELSTGTTYFVLAQGYGGGIGDYQLQVSREE